MCNKSSIQQSHKLLTRVTLDDDAADDGDDDTITT